MAAPPIVTCLNCGKRRVMQLYPQPRGRTQAVEYVPSPQALPRPRREIPARGQRS